MHEEHFDQDWLDEMQAQVHEDRAKKEANRPGRGETAIKRTEIPESSFSEEIVEVPGVVKRHVLAGVDACVQAQFFGRADCDIVETQREVPSIRKAPKTVNVWMQRFHSSQMQVNSEGSSGAVQWNDCQCFQHPSHAGGKRTRITSR